MSQANRPLVGSVFERKPVSHPPASTKVSTSGVTGFPAVQHRSKSAFARGREKANLVGVSRLKEAPPVLINESKSLSVNNGKRHISPGMAGAHDWKPGQASEKWRQQVSRENERIVEGMSDEERAQERTEIMERFGAGVGDLLKRAKEAREARDTQIPKTEGQEQGGVATDKFSTSGNESELTSEQGMCDSSSILAL